MIPLVSSAEMRAIDEAAIQRFGVPSLDLMERAGRGVVEALVSHFGPVLGRSVLVLCGRGNNGGDGLVAARVLREQGADVRVLVTAAPDQMSGDARVNLERWVADGGFVHHAPTEEEVDRFFAEDGDVELVLDALLGTGSSGAARGAVLAAIRGVERMGAPVLSIDIPSGIDADRGTVPGEAVEADLTVTLAFPKRGHYLLPAREQVGILEVAEIGIPRDAALAATIADFLIEAEDVRDLLPHWPAAAHKGSRGRLLVVGGSVGLTGAVVLAGNAGLRAGAGLVTVGVPESLSDVFEIKLTEVMKLPLPQGAGRHLGPAARERIREFAGDGLSAMVVGPGFSRHKDAMELARQLVGELDCPKVIDADALFAFNGRPDDLARKITGCALVLTPHPGEAARLLGRTIPEIEAERIDLAAEWGERLGQVIVLKGSPTVIGSPEGETFVNPTGGPALASGGTGDVLAGMIGGFLAQGLSPVHAAIVAVYLHGATADLIVERRGPYGLVASDLIEAMPDVMGDLSGSPS
jgi:hydroxyethylthiazole kinase-like uncharacterized protein yjeF